MSSLTSDPRRDGAVDQPSTASSLTYVFAVLLSAALLFAVQPMVAKAVLPRLGGAPSTWTTCLLFFQVVLLAGYCYVHVGAAWLRPLPQALLHVAILTTAALVWPLSLSSYSQPDLASPTPWLLRTLIGTVGLPFFAVSATAPLLQRWFALATGREPYFLYAASNVGSLVGLLAYPVVIERVLTTPQQQQLWTTAFLALAVIIAACAVGLRRQPSAPGHSDVGGATTRGPGIATQLAWLGLAFVPSSLLLGVTAHISTDLAAVPLLWVVPLALYLLTFVVAFSPRFLPSRHWLSRATAVLLVAAVLGMVAVLNEWLEVVAHIAAFTSASLMCHSELARRRPAPVQLTRFFLLMSVGGALGGSFNALVAPQLFSGIYEYPLMLIAAAFIRPAPAWRDGRDEPWGLVAGVPLLITTFVLAAVLSGVAGQLAVAPLLLSIGLLVTTVLVAANRRLAFAGAFTLAMGLSLYVDPTGARGVLQDRSFFGVVRVSVDERADLRRFHHGSTMHGLQPLTGETCEPTAYFSRPGPIGQVFEASRSPSRVAVLGLGVGTLACYATPGSKWTFYEIDPLVERVASDATLFSFLDRSAGVVDVKIGDGRLLLAAEPQGQFDVIVMDAFSSDAVPAHLLTSEFMAIAFDRLKPNGLLAFNISNRYLDLAPIVASAAASAGADALVQSHVPQDTRFAYASRWVVVARASVTFDRLRGDPRWRPATGGRRPWTDDFSNIIDAVAW